jgi:hypothetical protein
VSTLLPTIPVEPLNAGRYPRAMDQYHYGHCQVCRAEWCSFRAYGKASDFNQNGIPVSAVPSYPHIAYKCGAIWRDIGNGYWEGQCCAPKTKQLTLNLEADE